MTSWTQGVRSDLANPLCSVSVDSQWLPRGYFGGWEWFRYAWGCGVSYICKVNKKYIQPFVLILISLKLEFLNRSSQALNYLTAVFSFSLFVAQYHYQLGWSVFWGDPIFKSWAFDSDAYVNVSSLKYPCICEDC